MAHRCGKNSIDGPLMLFANRALQGAARLAVVREGLLELLVREVRRSSGYRKYISQVEGSLPVRTEVTWITESWYSPGGETQCC
jgi:hypothetical protein